MVSLIFPGDMQADQVRARQPIQYGAKYISIRSGEREQLGKQGGDGIGTDGYRNSV